MTITWPHLLAVAAPNANPHGDAIALRATKLSTVAAEFGLTTPARIAGFLANIAHETGDFHRLRENLNYSTAARIRMIWPTHFASDAAAQPFVGQPEALANKVYARPGEGNTHPGDGWRFRGGGDIQLTFRNGFVRVGRALGVPLEEHPELIESPGLAIAAALVYWRDAKVNTLLDAGKPKRARSLVNAGTPNNLAPIGWPDVSARYARLLAALA